MTNSEDKDRQEGARVGPSSSRKALPKIDFSTLILSLSTSTLYSLGVAPDPETGALGRPNLDMARQTIDTLEVLQEKTRGNLDAEEHKLLDSLLYELRLRFVEVSG